MLHLPDDPALAERKRVAVGLYPHGFVGCRKHAFVLLVLHKHETTRVVRIVGLFRLHERLRFQIRRMRILRRFRLHKLGYRISAAVHVNHHRFVP
ncbi:hypothetical protein D3C81_954610 [compost metagenome]